MDLANKSFKDNRTGEVVKVIDSFENIAILENKQKMDVRKLTNPDLFTEQIDVANFFSNQGSYNSLAEKIKNIPIENIVEEDNRGNIVTSDGVQLSKSEVTPSMNESAVIISSIEEEKAELARKYGIVDNKTSVQNQNAAFAKILDEDQATNNSNKETKPDNHTIIQPPIQRIEVSDPITNMFRNVKRNVTFKINIEISNKIPRVDFIEMMEDSYDVSIIDFLAEEFTQNILKNPNQIKDMIKDKITKIVYGNGITEELVKKSEVVKKKATKKPTPPKNQVIREGKEPKKTPPPKPLPPKSRRLKEGEEPEKPKNYNNQND